MSRHDVNQRSHDGQPLAVRFSGQYRGMVAVSDIADIAGEEQARLEAATYERLTREQAARESQQGSEYCVECGFDIPAARRDAMPWVTRCVSCQEFIDRQAKRFR